MLYTVDRMDDGHGSGPAGASIEIRGLVKTYERVAKRRVVRTHAIEGVDISIRPQEFVSLVGPSGCGKTTVLNIIAGLLPATAGEVLINGKPVNRPGPDRGVVFQQASLMPWLTVEDNLLLALRFAKVPRAARRERVERYVEMVNLQDFLNHYPGELSGGMQQRAGIARALALEPQVLLMDEPFGALDAITRQHLQLELLAIWEKDRRSVLFVTHALEEALLLSDRIIVMEKGRVASDITVPMPRPRTRVGLIEDPEARALHVALESML